MRGLRHSPCSSHSTTHCPSQQGTTTQQSAPVLVKPGYGKGWNTKTWKYYYILIPHKRDFNLTVTRHLMPSIRLSVILQSLKINTDWTLALCRTQLPLKFSFHSINPLSPQSSGSQPVVTSIHNTYFWWSQELRRHSGANLPLWSGNTVMFWLGSPQHNEPH